MKCKQCQTENIGNGQYCRECGERLVNICVSCGFQYESDDNFCGGCGISVVEISASSDKKVHRPHDINLSKHQINELFLIYKERFEKSTGKKTVSQEDLDKLFG